MTIDAAAAKLVLAFQSIGLEKSVLTQLSQAVIVKVEASNAGFFFDLDFSQSIPKSGTESMSIIAVVHTDEDVADAILHFDGGTLSYGEVQFYGAPNLDVFDDFTLVLDKKGRHQRPLLSITAAAPPHPVSAPCH